MNVIEHDSPIVNMKFDLIVAVFNLVDDRTQCVDYHFDLVETPWSLPLTIRTDGRDVACNVSIPSGQSTADAGWIGERGIILRTNITY
jgi:hypothetical protein